MRALLLNGELPDFVIEPEPEPAPKVHPHKKKAMNTEEYMEAHKENYATTAYYPPPSWSSNQASGYYTTSVNYSYFEKEGQATITGLAELSAAAKHASTSLGKALAGLPEPSPTPIACKCGDKHVVAVRKSDRQFFCYHCTLAQPGGLPGIRAIRMLDESLNRKCFACEHLAIAAFLGEGHYITRAACEDHITW